MRPWAPLVINAFALGIVGCGAGDQDATRARLSQMEQTVLELQNDRDRLTERVRALEAQTESSALNAESGAPETIERPPLRVVELTPEAPSEPVASAVPAEPPVAPETSTIEIRGTGTDVQAMERELR